MAKNKKVTLTTANGSPVADNQNSLTAGPRDDYTQAGDLFRLMKPDEKKRLIENLVNALRSVPRRIQERQIQHFFRADPDYGKGVALELGLPLSIIA